MSRATSPRRTRRRSARVCASIGAATLMSFTLTPAASAQVPTLGSLGQSTQATSSPFRLPTVDELKAQTEQNAWALRESIHRDADRFLPPRQARDAKNIVDNTIEAVFPGIIARHTDVSRPAVTPEPTANPCPKEAKACVDLDRQISWLQDGKGNRIGDVVPVSSGAKGHATPVGSHHVIRKVKTEVSREFGNAPMPNAIYFAPGGIAFHAGDPQVLSHGCVHLAFDDSQRYWDYLQPGDLVYSWGTVNYGVPNGAVHR